MTDPFQHAARIMIALSGDAAEAHGMIVPGPPRAKMRPKSTRHGGIMFDPSAPDQEALAKNLLGFSPRPLFGGSNVCLVMICYMPNFRRLDFDNLSKMVADAGTQAELWWDDAQITGSAIVLELDKAKPRTVLLIGSHASSLVRDITPPPVRLAKRRGPR